MTGDKIRQGEVDTVGAGLPLHPREAGVHFEPGIREGMVNGVGIRDYGARARITLSGDRQAVQLVLALGWQCVLLLGLDNRAGVA